MIARRILLRALFALCLWIPAVGPVLAADSSPAYYTDFSDLDLPHILAPPPAPGSRAQDADMSAVLDAQNARTPEDIDSAQADSKIDVFRFADVLGSGFSADKLPITAAFFRHVTDDSRAPVDRAKAFFNRPRPFASDPDVVPVVPKPANASYPSGHAAFAYLSATLLAIMVPEKAADLFARADLFAHNRVVGGVHYPTDIAAGRIAAALMAQDLLHDARFRNDLGQARAELRKGIGMP